MGEKENLMRNCVNNGIICVRVRSIMYYVSTHYTTFSISNSWKYSVNIGVNPTNSNLQVTFFDLKFTKLNYNYVFWITIGVVDEQIIMVFHSTLPPRLWAVNLSFKVQINLIQVPKQTGKDREKAYPFINTFQV